MGITSLIAFMFVFGLFVHGQEKKTERISVQKCKEYGKIAQNSCSFVDQNFSDLAAPKEFPHMALIGNGNEENIEWGCSGSLISDQYVISAAHCAISIPTRGRPKWVRLGDLNITSTTDDAEIQDFNISEIIIHPDFKRPSVYNDIVLIKLDRPAKLNEYVRPACIASGQDELIKKFIVSGWGETQNIQRHLHMKQDKNIERVSYEECDQEFAGISKRRLEKVNKETQLCAQPSKTDACQITSGAPLQYYNKDVECTYNIAGILSTGISFCSSKPEIYTKVSGYVDWIENIVWPNI